MFRFRISAQHWLPKIWNSTTALSFCIDCQKCEVPLPHFRSALTAKYVKFCSRTSALSLLAKIWSSAFRTCSARTSKDVKFRFRISFLPGLPKIGSFASALSLNLDCQRSEDWLLHYHSAFIAKKWVVPPPHFPSALTAKDLYFHISDLPSFQKMWTHFCSALTAKVLPPQFRCRFILCISTQFRAI